MVPFLYRQGMFTSQNTIPPVDKAEIMPVLSFAFNNSEIAVISLRPKPIKYFTELTVIYILLAR